MDIRANSPVSDSREQFDQATRASAEVNQPRTAPCPYQVKALAELADLARQVI